MSEVVPVALISVLFRVRRSFMSLALKFSVISLARQGYGSALAEGRCGGSIGQQVLFAGYAADVGGADGIISLWPSQRVEN